MPRVTGPTISAIGFAAQQRMTRKEREKGKEFTRAVKLWGKRKNQGGEKAWLAKTNDKKTICSKKGNGETKRCRGGEELR